MSILDPVLWWKLDELSGTTAADSGSGGNTGTLTDFFGGSGPPWTSPDGVECEADDGDRVQCNYSASIDIVGAVAVSALITPRTLTGGTYTISSHGYDGSTEGYTLRLQGDTDIRFGSYDGGDHEVVGTHGFSVDTEYHTIGVYTGSLWKIYINGIELVSASDATGAIASTQKFAIGVTPGVDRPFDGRLRKARVFNHTLTAPECLALYLLDTGGAAFTWQDMGLMSDPVARGRRSITSY